MKEGVGFVSDDDNSPHGTQLQALMLTLVTFIITFRFHQ